MARSEKTKKEGDEKSKRAVVVTTVHKGVFFGYADDGEIEQSRRSKTIALERARCCIYWSADMRGFMGLAAQGPSKDCKIGPAVPIVLQDITAIIEVESADAIKRWEDAPWR